MKRRRVRAHLHLPPTHLSLIAGPLLALCQSSCSHQTPRPSTSFAELSWQSPVGRDHPLVGTIWDVRGRQVLSPDDFLDRASRAEYVLLGEVHDNVDHHRLQALVVREVAKRTGRRPRLVVEMILSEQQPKVDDVLTHAGSNADALAQALDWNHSGWPSWSMYRPIFQAAFTAHLPIMGANISRSSAMKIGAGETTPDPAMVSRYRLDTPLPDDLEQNLRKELVEGHCGVLPDAMIAPMIGIQRLRDATMAEAMRTATADGAILIAGRGHTRADRGVPFYLRIDDGREESGKATSSNGSRTNSTFSVALIEVSEEKTGPLDYSDEFGSAELPFDAVWFTAARRPEDHCKELRKKFGFPGDAGSPKTSAENFNTLTAGDT